MRALDSLGQSPECLDMRRKGAGGHVHSGGVLHVRVSLEVARGLAEGLQILHGDEAPLRQGGVESGSAVALGEHQPVPVLHIGIFRIHVQFFKVKVREQIRDGEGPARVAGRRGIDRVDDADSDFSAYFAEFRKSFFVHSSVLLPPCAELFAFSYCNIYLLFCQYELEIEAIYVNTV